MKYLLFLFALAPGLRLHQADTSSAPANTPARRTDSITPIKITRLTDQCYVFVTYHQIDGKPYPANGMYVLTPAGAVLFDSPWDTTQCHPLLDSIQRKHHQKVLLCISTHFHADRTGGIPSLSAMGVKTYASAMTDSLCLLHHEPAPQYIFSKDTVFNVGGTRIYTYFPGPGHTLDNIVLWLEDEKLLYGGCLVKSTETNDLGFIEDGDVDKWPDAIRNLLRRYPVRNFVIPGHLDWRDTRSLDYTLALIRQYQQTHKR